MGIHSARLFGFAFWDMLATVVVAMLVSKWLFHKKHLIIILITLVLLGVWVHRTLGIKTKLNQKIFGN